MSRALEPSEAAQVARDAGRGFAAALTLGASASVATLVRLKFLSGLEEPEDLMCKQHGARGPRAVVRRRLSGASGDGGSRLTGGQTRQRTR